MFKNIYVEVLETKLHQCEKFTDALKNCPPPPFTGKIKLDILGSGLTANSQTALASQNRLGSKYWYSFTCNLMMKFLLFMQNLNFHS